MEKKKFKGKQKDKYLLKGGIMKKIKGLFLKIKDYFWNNKKSKWENILFISKKIIFIVSDILILIGIVLLLKWLIILISTYEVDHNFEWSKFFLSAFIILTSVKIIEYMATKNIEPNNNIKLSNEQLNKLSKLIADEIKRGDHE